MEALERLMEEFFGHATGNERRNEIEHEFEVFKSRPDAWILCSYFIEHSSSHYVIMFSLSHLESVIYKLDKVHLGARNEIRQIIQGYLFTSATNAPHFVREKYAKLLVDIAKLDWPHEYPDFMNFMEELLNKRNKYMIGLILMRITTEEFNSDSPIIDAKRHGELQRLMKPYIPKFLSYICLILDGLNSKSRPPTTTNTPGTATPPPSPTHPGIEMEPENLVIPINQFDPLTHGREDEMDLNREALKTLQHFFTWVPLHMISTKLLKFLFIVINTPNYSQGDRDLCLLALSTVNEILYRKCCPRGCESFFIDLYHYLVVVLRDLSALSIDRLKNIEPTFVQKLAELIILFSQQHFWRIDKQAKVSSLDFLSLFYNFTNALPTAQCYHHCLTAWSAVFKVVIHQNPNGDHSQYASLYQFVYTMLLRKLQFNCWDQLMFLNNQEVNDDNETEWASYVKISNEIIALMAGLAPIEVFSTALVPWKDCCESYQRIIIHIRKCKNIEYMVESLEEMRRLYFALMDFATLTQTLARLSSIFIDQDEEEVSKDTDSEIETMFRKLLECAECSSLLAVLDLKLNDRVAESLVLVHSELIAALRTWLFWMLQKNKLDGNKLNWLVRIVVNILMKLSNAPYPIAYSTTCLLHSITDKVSPLLLLEQKALMEYMSMTCIYRHPILKIRELIDESVCNTFLSFSNGPNLSKQEVEQLKQVRFHHLNIYIDTLSSDFLSLTPTTEEVLVRRVSSQTLESLSHIIDYCGKFSNDSKVTINNCVNSTIKHAMKLFPAYEKLSDVSQMILSFFISVFRTLQHHIGSDGTREILDLFLKQALQNVDLAYVEKLLQLMKLVVETNARSNQEFLPPIVGLCLHNLYPMVFSMSAENPDVYLELLQLFYSLLAHRWAYFHQSQVRAGYSPCVEGDSAVVPQRPAEFKSILEVFGQALLQEDINISKFSIGALEDLNRQRNLYSKPIFREHLLLNFLNVLMEALMSKVYSLLSEDVQTAIYHMSFHNNQIFFSTFLPEYVSTLEGLSQNQRQQLLEDFKNDSDMPSFINHLKNFVSKTQNLRMCNS